MCESNAMRLTAAAASVLTAAGLMMAPPAAAGPQFCNDPYCTPGIKGGVVLGAPCDDTAYYVFGTTSWGRLVFCGSPRRYAPRYFRSPPMAGIKEENTSCLGYETKPVAQAPDGLFLSCAVSPADGGMRWLRGDA